MELSGTRIALRPRRAWEATDLGIIMLRAWWRPIYVLSLGFTVLVAGGVLSVMSFFEAEAAHALFVSTGVVWWLKPLIDRLVLAVLSRAVFGEPPHVFAMVRNLPSLLHTGLWWHLTFGRFDSARAYRLPVWQLERHGLRQRRERFRVLGAGTRSQATLLTLMFLAIELLLVAGLFGLLFMVYPNTSLEVGLMSEGAWFEDTLSVVLLVYLCAIALLEPVYVACGFGFYLNRRTVLEGWDIEQGFWQLSARISRKGSMLSASALAIFLMTSLHPSSSEAALEPVRSPTGLNANEVVAELLAEPPFHVTEEVSHWRLRPVVGEWLEDWLGDAGEDAKDLDLRWLKGLGALARVAEGVLWITLAGLAVWLGWHVVRWSRERAWVSPGTRPAPLGDVVQDVVMSSPALSPDPGAKSRELVANGALREALALLYRASVDRLRASGCRLSDGATEGEVVAVARRAASQEASAYVSHLVKVWLAMAYAGRDPGASAVLALCDRWDECFKSFEARAG